MKILAGCRLQTFSYQTVSLSRKSLEKPRLQIRKTTKKNFRKNAQLLKADTFVDAAAVWAAFARPACQSAEQLFARLHAGPGLLH